MLTPADTGVASVVCPTALVHHHIASGRATKGFKETEGAMAMRAQRSSREGTNTGSFVRRNAKVLFSLLLMLPLPASAAQSSIYGVVGEGEKCILAGTGCSDSGKLVRLKISGSNVTIEVVGDTGLDGLSALAFDPLSRTLLAGTTDGKLYRLDPLTATPLKIADGLLTDPNPPDEIRGKFLGPHFLTALAYHPFTAVLYGVVSDGLGDYLVRLDLSAVDRFRHLEVDAIGVIGSTNFAYLDAEFG